MEQRKTRVMVADDDGDFVRMNSTVLQEAGYEVVAVHSAAECRARILTDKPDLLLLDVMMESAHSGFDLSLEMQRRAETRRIPIVMVTAIGSKVPQAWSYEDLHDCRIPAAAIIEKPVQPEQLLKTIRETLQNW